MTLAVSVSPTITSVTITGDNTIDVKINDNTFLNVINGFGGITSFPTYQSSASGSVSAATFSSYANKRLVLTGASTTTYELPDAVEADIGRTWIINNASSAAIILDVDSQGQTVTKLIGSASAVTTDISIASGGVVELICIGVDNYILYGSGIA